MGFIGVSYGRPGEGSLTAAEMTQRQLITKAHPSMSDSPQSWEPAAPGTACWWFRKVGSVLPRPSGSESDSRVLNAYILPGRRGLT